MTKKMHPERKRMTGLTLVELMVAMAVGLLLLFAVVSLYLANKTSFRHQESNARIQEDGRFALESIAYDLRNASYTGCSVVSTHANVVNGFSTNWPLDSRNMLRGFNGTTGYPTDISTTGAQGDALVVLYRDNESEMVVLSHNAAASEFKLGALHTFKKGEVLHVTDCRRDTVFQMSGPDASDSDIVKHEVGALDPNNCRVDLGSSCDEAANSYTFAAGALISRLVSKAYYIAPASNGAGNSLYVKSLAGSTNGQALTFELLPNV